MPARCDPILYPDSNTVELRIRGDDDVETTIEWGWEQTLHLGADLIETALAAKRRVEAEPKEAV